MKRILTATVLVVLVFVAIRKAPLPVFWAGLAALAVLATLELRGILGRLGRPPWPVLAVAGTLACMGSFWWHSPPLAPVLTLVVVVVLVRAVFSREEPGGALDRVVGTLLPVLYLGLTLGHVGGLITEGLPEARETGEDLLVLALAAVYVGDTFAYYGGRLLGRHPLAPGISPAKTWEGAVLGVVGAVIGALAAPLWFWQRLPFAHAVILGLVLGVTGILGDLVESLFKRAATVKDSGGLLPGHGGVLDRIDSLLLAAPVLYWYHRLLLAP